MRHRKKTAKLGRTGQHRNLMLANMVCSLIKHRRVTTTLAKARAARSLAEKMITLGKLGTLHARRLAAARLRQEDAVRILFNEIAPTQKDRRGGYTRIMKMNQRRGDSALVAILEWVDLSVMGVAGSPGEKPAGSEKPTTTTTPAPAAPEAKPTAEPPAAQGSSSPPESK